MNLRIDEEFRDLLPPLTSEEYEGLRQALKQHGCLDAIKVWGDTIVDGHNRYKICNEEGIEYRTQQMDFANRDEAIVWICGNQDSRRNLNDAQRLRVSEIKNAASRRLGKEMMSRAASKENLQRKGNVIGFDRTIKPDNETVTLNRRQTIAKDAGVSEAAVQRYEEVEKNAPELMKPMLDGKVSISTAHSISKMDANKRKEFVDKIESGVSSREAAAKVRATEKEKEVEDEKVQTAVIGKPTQRMYDQKDFQVGSHDIKDWAVELQASTNTYISSIRMHFLRLQDYIVTKAEKKDIRDALDRIINVLNQLKGEYK